LNHFKQESNVRIDLAGGIRGSGGLLGALLGGLLGFLGALLGGFLGLLGTLLRRFLRRFLGRLLGALLGRLLGGLLGRLLRRFLGRLLGFLGGSLTVGGLLLGQKDGLDVGKHTAGSDRDLAEQLVQLLVVADGELKVTRGDASLLVVAGSVAGQLQDLGAQVLEHSGEVHGGATSDAARVLALLDESVHTADGELESRASRASLALAALGLAAAAFACSFAGHFEKIGSGFKLGLTQFGGKKLIIR
jgi:hypothetical protein